MAATAVNLEIDGRVGRVILNRPEHGNLITGAMMQALRDGLREAKGAVDVLAIESAGEDFTRGRDQNDTASGLSRDESLALALDVNAALAELEAIVIASVRGRAMGFGFGLVVRSDLVVASESAVFGFDEIAHGFPPMIVMSYLGRYLPFKQALDLIITHKELGAHEAASLGLVSRVVADTDLEARTRDLIGQLTSLNIAAIKRAKQYLREVEEISPEERSEYALRSQIEWFDRPPGS